MEWDQEDPFKRKIAIFSDTLTKVLIFKWKRSLGFVHNPIDMPFLPNFYSEPSFPGTHPRYSVSFLLWYQSSTLLLSTHTHIQTYLSTLSYKNKEIQCNLWNSFTHITNCLFSEYKVVEMYKCMYSYRIDKKTSFKLFELICA